MKHFQTFLLLLLLLFTLQDSSEFKECFQKEVPNKVYRYRIRFVYFNCENWKKKNENIKRLILKNLGLLNAAFNDMGIHFDLNEKEDLKSLKCDLHYGDKSFNVERDWKSEESLAKTPFHQIIQKNEFGLKDKVLTFFIGEMVGKNNEMGFMKMPNEQTNLFGGDGLGFLNYKALENRVTIIHEMGHAFGLHHTFRGVTEAHENKECDIYGEDDTNNERNKIRYKTGDYCEDTPPIFRNYDYSRAIKVTDDNNKCGLRDKSKDWLNPFDNFMSYSGEDDLRNHFTNCQKNRIKCIAGKYDYPRSENGKSINIEEEIKNGKETLNQNIGMVMIVEKGSLKEGIENYEKSKISEKSDKKCNLQGTFCLKCIKNILLGSKILGKKQESKDIEKKIKEIQNKSFTKFGKKGAKRFERINKKLKLKRDFKIGSKSGSKKNSKRGSRSSRGSRNTKRGSRSSKKNSKRGSRGSKKNSKRGSRSSRGSRNTKRGSKKGSKRGSRDSKRGSKRNSKKGSNSLNRVTNASKRGSKVVNHRNTKNISKGSISLRREPQKNLLSIPNTEKEIISEDIKLIHILHQKFGNQTFVKQFGNYLGQPYGFEFANYINSKSHNLNIKELNIPIKTQQEFEEKIHEIIGNSIYLSLNEVSQEEEKSILKKFDHDIEENKLALIETNGVYEELIKEERNEKEKKEMVKKEKIKEKERNIKKLKHIYTKVKKIHHQYKRRKYRKSHNYYHLSKKYERMTRNLLRRIEQRNNHRRLHQKTRNLIRRLFKNLQEMQ